MLRPTRPVTASATQIDLHPVPAASQLPVGYGRLPTTIGPTTLTVLADRAIYSGLPVVTPRGVRSETCLTNPGETCLTSSNPWGVVGGWSIGGTGIEGYSVFYPGRVPSGSYDAVFDSQGVVTGPPIDVRGVLLTIA